MPSDAEMLSVTDLRVAFGRTEVLHGVDLTVGHGERVAVVGQSGSGKSTLVAAILGLLPGTGHVTGGSIRLGDDELTRRTEKAWRGLRGEGIGLVPQDPMTNLNPAMRVGAQIADALVAAGLRGAAVEKRVMELLTEAGIPEAEHRAGQYPHEFSGGMRQRVLIAMALAREPKLLIADEPTSALDVTVQRRILDHLETLVAAHGTSLLFVTHDLGLAAERADRVVVMHDGGIVETGPAARLLRDPQHDYTRRLIEASPSLDREGSSPPRRHGTDPILVVEDLVKEFRLRGRRGGTFRAVDQASFSVDRGTTTAVVGESGSGKSTIAKMVLGLETPTSGTARIDGRSIAGASRAERADLRRRVQPVFQDPYSSLDPTFTVAQLVAEPLHIHRVGDRRDRRGRVRELLDQVALPESVAGRRPSELSGGQRQRVAIARALALDPELVICDEAVSALDVLVQDQILTLLADLQRDLGLSYLFITHDLAVVRQIAHRVVVMHKGRVVEHDTVDQIFTAPTSAYTAELLEAIPGAALAG